MRAGDLLADMKTENFSEGVRSAPAAAHERQEAAVIPTEADEDVACEDEVRERLLSLDEAALNQLYAATVRYRLFLPKEDVDDLVNEAIQRVLDGRRKWPRTVDFMAFLLETMRSVASEWAKRNRRTVPESRLNPDGEDGGEEKSFLERQPASNSDPEADVAFREFADRIEKVFGEDDEVMTVIIARVEGLTPAETQKDFNMTASAYAAAQKRLRRAVLAGNMDG